MIMMIIMMITIVMMTILLIGIIIMMVILNAMRLHIMRILVVMVITVVTMMTASMMMMSLVSSDCLPMIPRAQGLTILIKYGSVEVEENPWVAAWSEKIQACLKKLTDTKDNLTNMLQGRLLEGWIWWRHGILWADLHQCCRVRRMKQRGFDKPNM